MTVATATRATALAVVASFVTLAGAPSAEAAAWHQGTLPYETGCAASRMLVPNGTKAVPGGSLRVYYSQACGTNWVEYSGIAQMTAKEVTSSLGYTREVDYTGYAYSKQVYAPGNSKIQAGAFGPGWDIRATCQSSCTWTTLR